MHNLLKCCNAILYGQCQCSANVLNIDQHLNSSHLRLVCRQGELQCCLSSLQVIESLRYVAFLERPSQRLPYCLPSTCRFQHRLQADQLGFTLDEWPISLTEQVQRRQSGRSIRSFAL